MEGEGDTTRVATDGNEQDCRATTDHDNEINEHSNKQRSTNDVPRGLH